MSIFILAYAIGAGRLVWREIFQNYEDTWQETVHAITADIAEATLAGAGLAVFATLGTRTVRLMAGRIYRPGSTRPRRDWTLPARCRMGGKTVHPSGTTGERLTRADSGGPLPRTGETETTPRTRWSGGASQPIVPAMTVHNCRDVAPVLGAILHRLSYAGKTLAQSLYFETYAVDRETG